MCIADVITNEALKLEVKSLRDEVAALKAELDQQTHNSKSMPCEGCKALDECRPCWEEDHHPPCYNG